MPPPSITSAWPLIAAAAVEARNTTASATSLGLEQPPERVTARRARARPHRRCARSRSTIRAIARAVSSVRTNVGQTALTRTPVPASSAGDRTHQSDGGVLGRRVGARVRRADAAGGRGDGDDRAGLPRSRIPATTARVHRNGPVTLTSKCARQLLSVVFVERRALGDAGVVDEHVDVADLRERRVDRVLVGDVADLVRTARPPARASSSRRGRSRRRRAPRTARRSRGRSPSRRR